MTKKVHVSELEPNDRFEAACDDDLLWIVDWVVRIPARDGAAYKVRCWPAGDSKPVDPAEYARFWFTTNADQQVTRQDRPHENPIRRRHQQGGVDVRS